MLSLKKELEEAKETRQREKEREMRRAREDEEEIQILRERCERLEEENTSQSNTVCSSPLALSFIKLCSRLILILWIS